MLNKNVMVALDVFVMGNSIFFLYIANEVNFSTKMKIKFHVSVCLLYFMYPITNIYERKIQQTEEI